MIRENGSHWAMLEIAEQAAPGNTVSLWPRIAAQMAEKSRATARTSTYRKRITFAAGLGLLFVFIGLLVFVPPVRAFAESIIQRIGIAFVNTEQFGPNTEVGQPTTNMITPPPTLSVQEFQERLTFPLLTPSWLPEELTFIHHSISNSQSGQSVDIQYCRTEDMAVQSGCLFLYASYNAQAATPLLAESKEQTVEVNGQPGIYVHGGWQDNGQGDPNTQLGNLLWDDQVDVAYLTWMQDGVTYLLEAHYLGLTLEDMQRIASSMQGS